MSRKSIGLFAAIAVVLAAAVLVPAMRAFQNNPVNVDIEVSGYQANSSAPFNVSGNAVGVTRHCPSGRAAIT